MTFTTQSWFDPSIQFHRELRERLQKDKEAIEARILEIDAHIQKLESEARKSARVTSNGRKARRPKGENAKLVAELFGDANAALSMKEIAEKTNLTFSSVQRVLKDGYSQGEDGLWRRSKPSQ